MGKLIQEKIRQEETSDEHTHDIFRILHDYRKGQVARYKRKLRSEKKRFMEKKIQDEKRWEEERRNQILNQNMLGEEDIWEVLLDENQKGESCGDTQVLNVKPDRLCIAKEFVFRMGVSQKKMLFSENFPEIVLPKH